jgi:3-isopropylmalate dehydratase large subunit
MGTLVESIFSNKLGKDIHAGEIVWVEPDYIMSHDTMTWLALQEMLKITDKMKYPNRSVILFDHITPPATIEQAKMQRRIMNFIKKHNLDNFFNEGVCHQVMIEKGFVQPGTVIIGSDSHTCTYGALGAFGTGVGSTDIAVALATGKLWFKVPESILINVSGSFPKGVYSKDLILKIISWLGVDGANYRALEFTGPVISDLSLPGRITLSNMAIECGAKVGLIAPDEKTIEFLKHRTDNLVPTFRPKAVNGTYETKLSFDVSDLEPQVACPHDLDNLKTVSETSGTNVDEVFIGTCTNGRFEDLQVAASILKGKKVDKFTRTIVIPASVEIYKKSMETGLINIFLDAGCLICNPGCGPCLGRHEGVLAPGETALTTMNRNFRGRMGSPDADIYVASPATCAMSAITGVITDPREVL